MLPRKKKKKKKPEKGKQLYLESTGTKVAKVSDQRSATVTIQSSKLENESPKWTEGGKLQGQTMKFI